MPTPLRVPRALLRLLGPVLLLALVFLASPADLFGQAHTVGLTVTKTCPVGGVPPSSVFQCTFSVTNNDTLHGVINLVVTNQVPFTLTCPTGCGPILPVNCTQGGSPVTTLGIAGNATATCTGVVTETAPACGATVQILADHIDATGEDGGVAGLPAVGAATNGVAILACTPTPTPTPTNTPTPTPTPTGPPNTPTNTPTTGVPPPVVPTLSFPMMALLGLLLAGAGLFLARR